MVVKFRASLENSFSRKIMDLIHLEAFPMLLYQKKKLKDKNLLMKLKSEQQINDFQEYLKIKLRRKYFSCRGDINNTVPNFVNKFKEIRIALLHIDVDLYEPTKTCLEKFYPHVVKGGIISLDDYGAFPELTKL